MLGGTQGSCLAGGEASRVVSLERAAELLALLKVVFVVLRSEHRILCVPDKLFTTGLHLQPDRTSQGEALDHSLLLHVLLLCVRGLLAAVWWG